MNIIDEKFINEIWEKIDSKLSAVAVRAKNKLPSTSVNGEYDDLSISFPECWTNGFFPGMMWLMYDGTKKNVYRETAEQGEKLLDAALKNISNLHHDVGFMWHLSSGASYRLTGNEQSYIRNLYAANILAGRYNIKGGYIRAWDHKWFERDTTGFAIIDCMMNLPILYWASDVTGDSRYKYIAMSHADKSIDNHVRADGSVNHIINYNPETGEVADIPLGQGYSPTSSWSRGQAWALYGFTLSYIHTKEQRYIDTAKKIANYFIAACCNDYLPKCDFRSPKEPVIYDSSAGLIAANGLIELSRVVDENEADMYYSAACKLIKAVVDKFADFSIDTDSIISHGTTAYTFGEKHTHLIYSDFYFVEAINKLKGFNTFLW